MTQQWYAEAREVIADLRQLSLLTSDDKGAQRVAWTPVWEKAQHWFMQRMQAEGAVVSVDAAHNMWARLEGQSEEAVVMGSHLDSVPDGGWLDGALGVAAGMGVLRHYARQKQKPAQTLYVVSWADEEGARFGRSCFGSAVVSGSLDQTALRHASGWRDKAGITFEEAVRTYGNSLTDFSAARASFLTKRLCAYLELHIEQAPVLENMGKAVACVYGITGCRRQNITFHGQPTHSGAPISMRKDAFLAAAQASLAFRDIALAHNAYCTVGKVRVFPDVVTISPACCTISLDQRSMDAQVLQTIYAEAHAACARAAADNGVTWTTEPVWDIAPTLFDERLGTLCAEAVREATGEACSIFSGPLHDAAEMAKVIPSIMMFVMSTGGLSHCKQEDTPEEALMQGIDAFFRLANKVVGNK